MRRLITSPRQSWKTLCENIGFNWHTIDGQIYWDESTVYEFSEAEIDELESVTEELHEMCMSAVNHVIDNNMMGKLGIPRQFQTEIKRTRDHAHLYGRFDLAYDSSGNIKMLEYNADTPTSLFEASVVQWEWLSAMNSIGDVHYDQFNSIHEKLIARFKFLNIKDITLCSVSDNDEDYGTVEYLHDVAFQSGIVESNHICMDDIGYRQGDGFVDDTDAKINNMFKLYPWEWMVQEEFGQHTIGSSTKFIEPMWKMILSNKGILPILWELYPNHKNLLPAYFDPTPLQGKTMVVKPMLSREGADIAIMRNGLTIMESEKLGYNSPTVYQEYFPIEKHSGYTPVIGSWVIGDAAAGIGIREDLNEITGNLSRFIPHRFI